MFTMPSARTRLAIGAALLLTALASSNADAQYFGRNKVNWERFDFRVLPGERFELYFYPAESLATSDMSRMAHRWYERFTPLLKHSFQRSPIIFYADPPDFQQTNVIEGFIGEGTGGVTEGARERIIMPHTGVYAETDHVLGHEIVHVFQYKIAQAGRGGINSLGGIPLWLIEGMAEYLSLGRDDPNTAMWLRDALRRNDLPTLRQLTTDPRYFPYRFGQALWAYIGGTYGDDAVNRVFRAALERGWEGGLLTALRISSDSLSRDWHAAIRREYGDVVATRTPPGDVGRPVITPQDRGDQNVSPAVSPDGRYVAYYSSRGLFGIDLWLAEVETGRNVRQLTSVTSNPHFDALSFINTAGAWSPDGRKLAFVVYSQGDNEINVLDVASRRVERRIRVRDVGAMSDPSWSPDGTRLAFSGMKGGISDLYVYDLSSGQVVQLTNDREAQIHPTWSPDGRTLAFATDRGEETSFTEMTFGPMRLATIDVASRQVQLLPRFGRGKHIDPQYSPDGSSLYFVADHDGVSDLYRLTLANGSVARLTNVATGVSGIGKLSPAISVATQTGDILFSTFDRGGFAIRRLAAAEAASGGGSAVAGAPTPGLLPPAAALGTSEVEQRLDDPRTGLTVATQTTTRAPDRGLSLDYIGGPSIGIAAGGGYGTGLAGGIALGFSDMLGDRLINTVVQAQGEIKDVGAQALYLNRSRRWAWGGQAYHIPLAGAFASYTNTTFTVDGQTVPGTIITQQVQRQFFSNAQGIMQYPFSTTRRLEFSAGVQRVGFDIQVDSLYLVGNTVLRQRRVGLPTLDALTFGTASLALVGDYSFFGFTSPVAGGRYRFEATPYVGSLNYQTYLADYRRYFFANPVTLAIRGLHYGRYGGDAESPQQQLLFLGQPTLIRGYDANSFDVGECTQVPGSSDRCPQFSRLSGSRLGVASVELRIPLFGTERFGLINLPFLPTEIAPFFDAGAAWTSQQGVDFRYDRTTVDRVPVFSAGVTARVNVLGFAVAEIFWANPLQRPGKGAFFGFNLAPGW